jgi:hypothetical protein
MKEISIIILIYELIVLLFTKKYIFYTEELKHLKNKSYDEDLYQLNNLSIITKCLIGFNIFYTVFIINGMLYSPSYQIYTMILILSIIYTIVIDLLIIKENNQSMVDNKYIILTKKIDSIITIILLAIILYGNF